MDPITQGTLGAAAAVTVLARRVPFSAGMLAWMGAVGGMAADLDILIRSSSDPLLAIEFHRHFTHSLAFVPLGGVLSGVPWLIAKSLRQHWRWVLAATTIGYATHGLLDAFTTYGTLLLWPFSHTRVSWRLVSVVDPLFTLPLLGLVIAAVRRRSPRLAMFGLVWGAVYMALGLVQRTRAEALQRVVAEARGHAVERAEVFPMVMNHVSWRSVYRSDGRYFVDKLRVTLTGKACATPGTSVGVLGEAPAGGVSPSAGRSAALPAAAARAHHLIRWFSSGWVALDPEDPTVIGDLRYSFSPTEAVPIWGVRIDNASGDVDWVNNRKRRAVTFDDFVTLVARDGPGHRCY